MTPLNPIINHSELVKQHLIQMYMEKLNIANSPETNLHQFEEGIGFMTLAKIVQKSKLAKMTL
jgi:hypothetical protein